MKSLLRFLRIAFGGVLVVLFYAGFLAVMGFMFWMCAWRALWDSFVQTPLHIWGYFALGSIIILGFSVLAAFCIGDFSDWWHGKRPEGGIIDDNHGKEGK
jgi:uncharacterized membrane protein YidH (DUF202 family)